MKEKYVVSFVTAKDAAFPRVMLVKANNEEQAKRYFMEREKALFPDLELYGVRLDDVGYEKRGCPMIEAPDDF